MTCVAVTLVLLLCLRGEARGKDIIPPNTTTDLHITAYTTSPRSVTLYWTLAGDEACLGQALYYCVRKRLGQEITEANWSTSTIVDCWVPGTTDHITVTGLSGNGFWYFALQAMDEGDNVSGVSNNDCIRFSPSPMALCEGGEGPPDVTPPAAITDLHITGWYIDPNWRSVTLSWTPSGDDGTSGQATGYVIRKRLGEPITEANWSTSTDALDPFFPMVPGSFGTWDVGDLPGDGFWYFAMKASDEFCNYSGVSNNDCIRFSPDPLTVCSGSKPVPAQAENTPAAELAITGVRSSPTSEGGVEISFTLANGPPATLAVFDVAGRRVEVQDLSHVGPGANSVRIGARLAAGHYWVRIDQEARSATRDVILLH